MAKRRPILTSIPCWLLITVVHCRIQQIAPGDLKNSSASLQKRLPQAIIIGVKKAGTRAVLEYLRLHSMIKAAGPEVHFFDRNYANGLRWYREKMPLAGQQDVVLEKTPKYFVTKEAPSRIKRMNGNVKLIVVVRNPVTRAMSEYAQVASKRNDLPAFERMAFVDPTVGLVNTSWHAIDTGLYDKHVLKWLKTFPRKNILFVSGEGLISNPTEETERLQSFLGLPLQISPLNFDLSGRFPCLRKWPSTETRCLGKSKGRPHPHVDQKLLKALSDFYRSHNERFFQLIGQNFSWSVAD